MKRVWWVLILLTIVSCKLNVDVIENDDGPILSQVSLDDFGFGYFSYLEGTDYQNYNAAVFLAEKGQEMSLLTKDIITLYNSLVEEESKFFAGQTWYWENDTAILYATYENENSVFCELFIESDTSKRLLWGTYILPTHTADFFIPTKSDTIRFQWTYATNSYLFVLQSISYPGYVELRSDYSEYDYKYYFGDSAFVHLGTDRSGQIKYYAYFKDSLWHCWDRNYLDCACGEEVSNR